MIRISPLKEEDIPALVSIENLSFSAPKDEDFFRNQQNKYLVAEEDDKIVGYIGVERISGETHIINMAVDPDFRGRGIGKQLIESILNDKDMFFLEVRVSNIPAQQLYRRYGFEIVGTREEYYNDNAEDAYIMRREAE